METLAKGERTRQNIIRKAAAVFNQHGYSGTSLADVMKKTGLEKGGIYRHFESKQQLAVAAFDYAWCEAKRYRLEALDGIDAPLKRLHAMVDHFADKPSLTPGGCPLLNTAVDADDGDPELRAHAKAALHEWMDMVKEAIDRGIRAGEIRRGTSSSSIASILIATLEGSVMMSRLDADRSAREFARVHLHGLLDSISVQR